MWKTSLTALVGACLAGCAASPQLPAPAGTVAPISLFDGNYQGRVKLVAGHPPTCPVAHYGVLEVGDATLTYAYTPAITFTTPVGPDGGLHQRIGDTVLDGRIARDHLGMSITSPACKTLYDMGYVWNHSSTAPVRP